jgi:hypothetical protein
MGVFGTFIASELGQSSRTGTTSTGRSETCKSLCGTEPRMAP